MSTADELRHAAKLLREVSEGATPGPWKHMCLASEGCLVLRDFGTIRERGKGRVARFGRRSGKPTTRTPGTWRRWGRVSPRRSPCCWMSWPSTRTTAPRERSRRTAWPLPAHSSR